MELEMASLTRAIQALVESMAEIKPIVLELKEWRPMVASSVEELRGEVGALRNQVQQMVREAAPATPAVEKPPLLPLPTVGRYQSSDPKMGKGRGRFYPGVIAGQWYVWYVSLTCTSL